MEAASQGDGAAALSNDKIFVLTCVYLAALSLSLVGSSSVLAVSTLRRRCFHSQLLPLFLLSLADFLAALVLIITAAIQLLPAQLFVLAYEFCPYGLMLAMMFYAISFLMVIVYAYEVNRTIRGWRVTHMTALQVGADQAFLPHPAGMPEAVLLPHRAQPGQGPDGAAGGSSSEGQTDTTGGARETDGRESYTTCIQAGTGHAVSIPQTCQPLALARGDWGMALWSPTHILAGEEREQDGPQVPRQVDQQRVGLRVH
ncbi:uncharacterized protein LOC141993100 [Natator depressus]|uniref:uncharacterized protein LOC141993100 n=1 Tax=Natator depressus TaxID=27790 RepID=UPI003EBABFF6